MLDGHPCLLTAAQPFKRMGAITTKETYYFVSTKVDPDARQFLVPWMGFENESFASSDDAWKGIDSNWLGHARTVADMGTATTTAQYYSKRSYTSPGKKVSMKPCERYFIMEGVPTATYC
jgi:hypothetical protein